MFITYRHCQDAVTEKQLAQRKQILVMKTDLLLNDKITCTGETSVETLNCKVIQLAYSFTNAKHMLRRIKKV